MRIEKILGRDDLSEWKSAGAQPHLKPLQFDGDPVGIISAGGEVFDVSGLHGNIGMRANNIAVSIRLHLISPNELILFLFRW